MNQVELLPALVWDCPECGIENFNRTYVPEMSVEDREAYYDDLDVEDGNFVIMIPTQVQCFDCKSVFDSVYFDEAEPVDVEDFLEP